MKNIFKKIGFLCTALLALSLGTSDNKVEEVKAADGTWTLVTDATTLEVGDQVVIAALNGEFAMSTTQNSNNRGQAKISKNNDTLLNLSAEVEILTIELGLNNDTFAFNTGEGYLCAASSSSNYLRTEKSISANSSWSISIEDTGSATVKSTGSYTRNWLRHNSSSKIFACYSSGQNDIAIYKMNEDLNTCEHNFVKPTEGNEVEITPATCSTYAVYTKVCSLCNKPSDNSHDFYNGTELLEHNYNAYEICNNCNAFKNNALESLKLLLNKYYNGNQYLKETVINTKEMTDKEVSKYFHASASVKERETWYFGDSENGTNKLKMITNEDVNNDGVLEIVKSTYENKNGSVYHTGLGGDWSVNWTSVESKFVTLKDFIDSKDTNWEYTNNTFTYNLKASTATTEEEMTRMAREFVAPMWLEPNLENWTYLSFTKLTIKETNNQLVMKLYVNPNEYSENESEGKITDKDGVFAEATINKVYNLNIIPDENCSVVEETNVIAANHAVNYNINVKSGYELDIPTATKAKVSLAGTNSISVSNATGNVEVTLTTKLETNEKNITVSFATTSHRVTQDSNQQIWSTGGVTITNNKGASTSNIVDSSNPVRFYANSQLIIEAEGDITQIIFDANSASYATALKNSIEENSNINITISSDKVTVKFNKTVSSFTVDKLSAQVRMDSITVTYTA